MSKPPPRIVPPADCPLCGQVQARVLVPPAYHDRPWRRWVDLAHLYRDAGPIRLSAADTPLIEKVGGIIWHESSEVVAYCASRWTHTKSGALDELYGREAGALCNTAAALNRLISRERQRDHRHRRTQREHAAKGTPIDHGAIYDRNGGRCHICGRPVDPAQFHLDHVIPLSRGGAHSPGNLRVAHPTCNLRKAASEPPRSRRSDPGKLSHPRSGSPAHGEEGAKAPKI